MKIKWLVTNVTVVGSPDKADYAIFGLSLAGRCFLPIHAVFVIGGHFVV